MNGRRHEAHAVRVHGRAEGQRTVLIVLGDEQEAANDAVAQEHAVRVHRLASPDEKLRRRLEEPRRRRLHVRGEAMAKMSQEESLGRERRALEEESGEAIAIVRRELLACSALAQPCAEGIDVSASANVC